MRRLSSSRRAVPALRSIIIVLAALACGETLTGPRQGGLTAPPTSVQTVVRIDCIADVHARRIACSDAASSSSATSSRASSASGINADLILGGQNTFVQLTSSGVTYSGDVFSFNTTVKNLIGQKLGVTAGTTTLDPTGVRVFFQDVPHSSTGAIDFVDPVGGGSLVDGYASFTAANQPYYQYNEIIDTTQTSSAKNWRIHVPASVASFTFTVYVSAPVEFPSGWIDVAPPTATMNPGATQPLSATVRDEVGRVLTGQTVTWSSLNAAVATVDPTTGVVTAVANGVATINATSTSRTGSAAITVNSASGMIINAGDAQTALAGAAVTTRPSVLVRDQNSNPMPNVPVTFSVTGGGGSATVLSTTTNASGIATVGSWTLGAGGAGCSAAAITNCSRNALHAVAGGGTAPSVDFVGYIPPVVPSAATYQAVGNATLPIAAGIGALQNAFSINGAGANGQGATLSVTTPTPAGTQGGTATIASDGSFTYLSSPSYVSAGAATEDFVYSVSDGIAALTTSALVHVNVPEHVWYVQPGYGGTSTGSDVQPFKDFSNTAGQGVEAAAIANDTILVKTGSGTAAGGQLSSSQLIYGQGATAPKTFLTGAAGTYRNGGTLITLLGTGSAPLVAALSIATNNTLRGLTLGGSGATALSGSSFGTLTALEMAINGTAGAIDLTSGSLSGGMSSVTSTGGVNNVKLTNVGATGSFGFGTGQLSGATGDAFLLSGGTGALTYGGNILKNASSGSLVNINSRSSGNVTLSGDLSCLALCGSVSGAIAVNNVTGGTITFSGANKTISSSTVSNVGVYLLNNVGAFIDFTNGGLQVSAADSAAFRGVNGGTITVVPGANANTLATSTKGTALRLVNTAIGAGNLTFRSIATTNADSNSIALTNTGTSGGLVVTGTGTSGSGGTIGNTKGADGATSGNAIYLNGTNKVSLSWMNITTNQNNGIYASSVRGLALDHIVFSGNQGNTGSIQETAIQLVDIGGAVSITNSTIAGGATGNVRVINNTGSAPTVDSLVFANNTVGTLQNTGLSSIGLLFIDGTADVRIRNNVVNYWFTQAISISYQSATTGNVTMTGNTVSQTNSFPFSAARTIVLDGGNIKYDISGNSLQGARGAAIALHELSTVSSLFHGTINNNTIGTSGSANSGSSLGDAITLQHFGAGTSTHAVTNNIIRQVNGSEAILIQADSGTGGSGTMNVTATGNDIQQAGSTVNSARNAITLLAGTQPGDAHAFCIDIGGAGLLMNNIVNFNTASAGNDNRMTLTEVFLTSVRMPGYTGANNDVAAVSTYLLGRNTASRATVLDNVTAGGSGYLNTIPAGSACPQP